MGMYYDPNRTYQKETKRYLVTYVNHGEFRADFEGPFDTIEEAESAYQTLLDDGMDQVRLCEIIKG